MKRGSWYGRSFTTTLFALHLLVAVAVVAACGGGAGVSNQTSAAQPQSTYHTDYKNCNQGGGGSQVLRTIPPCPSPTPTPTPFDVIVANPGNNSVTSYVISANGNATPLAVLQGSNTKLSGNFGVYYDGDINIFVSNSTSNTVNRYPISDFAAGAGGNLSPDQLLTSTLLNVPYGAAENYSQSYNGDDVEYIVNAPPSSATPSVTMFQENASGNAPVYYSIAGNKTGLGNGQGIAIDNYSSSPTFGAIYVGNPTSKSVLMFLPSKQFPNPTQGQLINAAPYKTIANIVNPIGLYVDLKGYLYVVSNGSPAKIFVYAPSLTGATLTNTIADASLSSPYGVAVYTDQRVFVTNQGNNSITVYNNGESGPSSLVQNISGSATKLNKPAFLDLRITR